MKWIKENAGWVVSALGTVVIILGFVSGVFGQFVATEAEPVAKEVVETELQTHVLEIEPRLQAIEMNGDHNSTEIGKMQKKLDDSMEIQKQILEKVSD
jgi:hypothetical protein